LLHIRASIHTCRIANWHIAVIKVDGTIYKGILEPLLVEAVNEVSNSFPQYILQASMFSSPEKSFVLPVYAEAMAGAFPPTQPSCIPRQRNVDPRILEFFDITATVDASFPVDCSDSESSSLSSEIFQWRSSKSRPCSNDSMSQSSYLFASIHPVGLVSFLHSCNETSRATAFDFYDGIFVFWIKRFFLVEVFCFITLYITAFS
jgi:hypothetical protein